MMSLRDAVQDDDWLSSMLLLFRNEMHRHSILIIVEGTTDVSFFNTYRLDRRFIYESPESGKREVIMAVHELRQAGNDAVYGICDADFDALGGVTYDGIFYTDAHDLEMMLVKGGVVDKFIMMNTNKALVHGERGSVLCQEIKDSILHVCYRIGIFKLYNYFNRCGLNFKMVKYTNFIEVNGSEIEFNEEEYIKAILDKNSHDASESSLLALNDEFRRLELMSPDYFSICNGHDFTCILKIMYSTDISVNKNMRIDEVERYLRISYDGLTFRETKLHDSLSNLLSVH